MDLSDFENCFKYYSGEPHQREGIELLFENLPDTLKKDEAYWIRRYRKQDVESSTTEGTYTAPRYFSQRDNYRDASRTCFSSSCAMLLESLKPGTLPGDRGDDKYIQTVFSIGDTTEASVQLEALRAYGINAKFIQNGSLDLLRSQLDKGIPVPCGILHHGPAGAPSGGGHWICVIGYDETGFIVHDPWGEIDHASGTYISTEGANLHYSNNLMSSRWTVSSANDGWCIIV